VNIFGGKARVLDFGELLITGQVFAAELSKVFGELVHDFLLN
jgi:hypothetical protein